MITDVETNNKGKAEKFGEGGCVISVAVAYIIVAMQPKDDWPGPISRQLIRGLPLESTTR